MDEILLKAKELFSNTTPSELIDLAGTTHRSCLVSAEFKHLRQEAPQLSLVEAPSSEENSDEESGFPSIPKISNLILDSSKIEISDSFQAIHHPPALIISPVGKYTNWLKVFQIFEHYHPKKTQIVELYQEKLIRSAIIWFYSLEEAQKALAYFEIHSNLESLAEVLHENKGIASRMVVKWFVYHVYDPSANWNAVILRGLPDSFTINDIKMIIKSDYLRIEGPRNVNGFNCCIVVVKSIGTAERICMNHKNRNNLIKIDLHPLSHVWNRNNKSLMKNIRKFECVKKVQKVKCQNKDLDDIFEKIMQDKKSSTIGKLVKNPLESLIKRK